VPQPFDAVLVIAFGGPQAPPDIRPFLANVLRGRRVAPGRVEEVAHHYERVGGRSPITELTMKQAEGLAQRLAAAGMPLPVFVGMRNWHPYLIDALRAMSRVGIRRAAGFIAAAHRSYSSCTQYRENVAEARATLVRVGLADVEVTYVSDWFAHPLFVAANADRLSTAFDALDPSLRDRAQVVFTAHSIPVSMAEKYPYREQFEETARLIAEKVRLKPDATEDPNVVSGFSRTGTGLNRTGHATVYQSRSGRPEDPWLGPDVCEYLRDARAKGLEAAVLSPIGFICDHVEVLFDLDIEAAEVARDIGLPLVRAQAVNDHPLFLDMMADVVLQLCRRYQKSRPLEVVATP
jgi:protoporphyrin/coproporphyrin ferrochelatase